MANQRRAPAKAPAPRPAKPLPRPSAPRRKASAKPTQAGPDRSLAAILAALVEVQRRFNPRINTRASAALLMAIEWIVRVVRHFQAAPAGSLLLCDHFIEPKDGQGGAAGIYTGVPRPAAPEPPPLAPQLGPVHLALASAALDALEELAALDKHLGLAELYAVQVDDDLHTVELKNDLRAMRLAMVGLTGRMAELCAPLTGTGQEAPLLSHATALGATLRASLPVAAGAEDDRFRRQAAALAFNRAR